MRLARVNSTPTFEITCKKCGLTTYSNSKVFYANLDGTPFKSYYCADCVLKLSTKYQWTQLDVIGDYTIKSRH